MRTDIWSIVYLVGFGVYVAIRGVFGGRTKKNDKVVRRVDAPEFLLMGLVTIGNMVLPMMYLFTPWLGFADYSRCEIWDPSCGMRWTGVLPWAGAMVMVAALWLFWRSHVDLGLNWSMTLEMRKGHELVTRGVYRRVRHPMYAAIFLFAIGQGLLLRNWVAGWGGLVSFALMYLVRAPREEKMMSEYFGKEYGEYVGRTGRLWPRWRSSARSEV